MMMMRIIPLILLGVLLLEGDAVVIVTMDGDGTLRPAATPNAPSRTVEAETRPGSTKMGLTAAVAEPATVATQGSTSSAVNRSQGDEIANLLEYVKPEAAILVHPSSVKRRHHQKSPHSEKMQQMLVDFAKLFRFLVDPLRSRTFPPSYYTAIHDVFAV